MAKLNCLRKGCKDVFHSFLVENAEKNDYDGDLEIPIIKPINAEPNRLIRFSKALKTNDFDQWVHFYEDDVNFERVWNRPRKYLPILKKFNGVITPDFSLYRDMPLVLQQYNTYRGKALGFWWQENGINVIPNIRFADSRSYDFCFLGISQNSIIAIGSLGCLKIKEDRDFFKAGLEETVKRLRLVNKIVVYGSEPEYVFSCCYEKNISILQFDSEISTIKNKKEEI